MPTFDSTSSHEPAPAESNPVFALVMTHTPERLRPTLLGICHQTRPPDGVIVSCDHNRSDISDVVQEVCEISPVRFVVVQRPHHGEARLNQVRNNAVRALIRIFNPPNALLVILDGDCVAKPDLVEAYVRHSRTGNLLIGGRHELTPEQSRNIDEQAIRNMKPFAEISRNQSNLLSQRRKRSTLQQWLRRVHLAKRHKPKTIGANHAVTLDLFKTINGYDEEYTGYGCDDDDFCWRAYAAGARSSIAVDQAVVFHLYHPTRKKVESWHAWENSKIFLNKHRPVRCRKGLQNPISQEPLVITEFNRTLPVPLTNIKSKAPASVRPLHSSR